MIEQYFWPALSENQRLHLLKRPVSDFKQDQETIVKDIISKVSKEGDRALIELTNKFDKVQLNNFEVSTQEISKVENNLSQKAKQAIVFAAKQIHDYHHAQQVLDQKIEIQTGVICERKTVPLERVGLYVPGGSAPLISTLLMLAMPSLVAKCPMRILCTPPDANGLINPHLLYAAKHCQIEKIYKVGGAQAIAAMAYGTESIPKVDKIFGPGNHWVTLAKQLVSLDAGGAAIDLPAGPSELMVIADETANPLFVAADLLSQAEHNSDSQVILATTSERLAEKTLAAIHDFIAKLPRKEIISQALNHARIFIVNEEEELLTIANGYGPEHLIINTKQPETILHRIQNAGTIFVGPWAAESLGDYVTGSNHVLPTGSWVRSCSGLSLKDFTKTITIQRITEQGIKTIGPSAEVLANLEGLQAHEQAVTVRLNQLSEAL